MSVWLSSRFDLYRQVVIDWFTLLYQLADFVATAPLMHSSTVIA